MTQGTIACDVDISDEVHYQHSFRRNLVYTPGVKRMAEDYGAYWLIDAIASYFNTRKMMNAIRRDPRLRDMQFWTLKVVDRKATLCLRADSGVRPCIIQSIPYTDFPLDQMVVWAAYDGQQWTLYLPSEH